MQRCPDERFVIAGSPVYISAAEQDILAGVPALHDAATQLIIVTSQGYRGPLQPFLKKKPRGHDGAPEIEHDVPEYCLRRRPD